MKKTMNMLLLTLCIVITGKVSADSEHDKAIKESRLSSKQLDCLAKNVYFEAGNEPFDGKIAVAQVTVNRLGKQGFPDNICGVVHQKTQISHKSVCQFSWYCQGRGKSKIDKDQFNDSMRAAKKVLVDGYMSGKVKDAMYFHERRTHPGWKLSKVGQVGNHIFYKPKSKG